MKKMSIIGLMKSIVINIPENSEFINLQNNVYGLEEIDDSNKSQHKYYLNMAGLPHITNTDIKMISLDDGTEIILTPSNLSLHSITLHELREYDDVFNYVNRENGYQESYLRGIINPIPLSVSTVAEPYEVLYLDERFYDKREDNLKDDIKRIVTSFMHRWFNYEYMFENRYMPTIYSQILSLISLTILNTRMKNIGTDRASNYDIEDMFKSYNHIDNLIPYIDDETKLWIYLNMPRLARNISKDSTLQDILLHVLKPSGYNLFDIVYSSPEYILTNVNNPLLEPWKIKPNMSLINRDPSVPNDNPEKLSEKEFLTMQVK